MNTEIRHPSNYTPDWAPFSVAVRGSKPIAPRPVETKDGIGDRLRAAAFAELQAREAFLWGADYFKDASDEIRAAWRKLSIEEDKHLNWLLKRMNELGISITERPVSDHLWLSFGRCKDAREFSLFMASAEERGRRAGNRVQEAIKESDPESSRIFREIAFEEISHVEMALKYYPDLKAELQIKMGPN